MTEKKEYWFRLARPLVCEGCGRSLWRKGMYHALTAHGRPGPVAWIEVGKYKGKPTKELVRSSVTVVPLNCPCGRAHMIRVLWLPREFGSRRAVPQDGFQIWSSENEQEAYERVLNAILHPPVRKTPGEVFSPMSQQDAERAKEQIQAMREKMGW